MLSQALNIVCEQVQINLGPNVGDITIGYDPPSRGRVIPLEVRNDKAHEDGGSRSKLTEGPRPKGDLRPTGINHHMFNMYVKEIIDSITEPDTLCMSRPGLCKPSGVSLCI